MFYSIYYNTCAFLNLYPLILYLSSGQARLDGAFCDYTEEDKRNFLKRAHARGIANIEMESLCFAAMCHRAGVKSTTCFMVHSPIK